MFNYSISFDKCVNYVCGDALILKHSKYRIGDSLFMGRDKTIDFYAIYVYLFATVLFALCGSNGGHGKRSLNFNLIHNESKLTIFDFDFKPQVSIYFHLFFFLFQISQIIFIKRFRYILYLLQLSKKNEIMESKVLAQIDTVLPIELRDNARKTWEACKSVRKYQLNFHGFSISNFLGYQFNAENEYKDSCDKAFYSSKCMYTFNPGAFLYP